MVYGCHLRKISHSLPAMFCAQCQYFVSGSGKDSLAGGRHREYAAWVYLDPGWDPIFAPGDESGSIAGQNPGDEMISSVSGFVTEYLTLVVPKKFTQKEKER